jgi:hypothetical protein
MVSYTRMAECYDLPAQDCNFPITSATCVVLIRSSKYCTPCTHELMIRGLTVMIIGPNTQLLLAVPSLCSRDGGFIVILENELTLESEW